MSRDSQLLQQFVWDNSQDAFRQLVERHSHWLYSVCRRRLRDSALAEDATQVVFLALAQRAPKLLNENTISPWLHQAARFCASKVLRERRRRQHYETEAATMKSALLPPPPDSSWQLIELDLEPALDRLAARDREAILLRFYEQKSHPEIAALLGISLEASQKRLSRALGRLRAILPQSAKDHPGPCPLAIGELLATHAVGTSPPPLISSLATSGTSATARLAPIARQALISMKMVTMKYVALAAMVLLFVIPFGPMFLHAGGATPALAQTPQPAPLTPAAPVSIASPATNPTMAAATVFKIPNVIFTGRSRPNEYEMGVDPDTKRNADSAPAGYIKSLLPKFNPNNQNPAMRVFKSPYTDLHGKRVRFSGWLKTKDVDEWAGLQIFIVGKDDRLILNQSTVNRPIHGTSDWTQEQIVVDVPPDAVAIAPLSFLYGKGEMWSDDLQLQAVATDVALTETGPWRLFSFFAPNYTAAADPNVIHDGHAAICVASTPQATKAQWVSYNREELNADKYRGSRITVTIWMKSSAISGGSGVWINVNGPSGRIASEGQIGHRPLHGTTDWKQYTAVVDVPNEATDLAWGLVMNETGKIWLDVDSAKCVVDDTSAHGL